ncbi:MULTISPECIES: sulfite dehydrogenase [Methylococcus]|jgi:sulfane dehydrogenase subunit SoxC|uniref:Sulfane dehydrogenase subunit SoxC n=2 Tax=Methylococcus capsulatus TaxID=414 RepID=A0AA35USR7_METCP|nr:sulfite dehydrogenase [Methylococcus capsulatus]AAU92455.1 putative sulfite oxidase SoxC [Methylococcus capsulatus str. Bath]QXP87803.1 sulfite dehydrogenase [Methylococcus capsulatus]QXP90844.1 sulfite dehydrogenase [Methylococcus capsulatus]QXP92458.1 sulfite dehydrogenase [Methylococcus capsulatus]UQN12822.1 sulfite dehydrogenase [Methylococcus capsulatus]
MKPFIEPETLPSAIPSSGPDRRRFLKAGLAVTGAALTGGVRAAPPPWMTRPGAPLSNYGQPSPHERAVIRWVAANPDAPGNGISWTPLERLEGIITPSGLHFERHHNGVPQIDPAVHRLVVHGLVVKSSSFGIDDLLRYPQTSRQCFVECGGNGNAGWHLEPMQAPAGNVHGLASCSEWTGVPLATVLEECGLQPNAKWLIAEGADAAAMNVSIPLEKALDDALLALYQNGERLRPENGYPLRLILPGWEGVTNVKWLHRLQLAEQPAMARNETAKYTELLPSGQARQFSFVMEAKSLITRPSAGQSLPGPGLHPISGLAWSGRGAIRRVEVSADGGKTWQDAALDPPVLPKCFTRFRLPWRWDGSPAVLKSRATDETGYVQPERQTLIAERGRHGYFHYNAIVSWAVAADGSVSHVYA